jgi:hypothetical protein
MEIETYVGVAVIGVAGIAALCFVAYLCFLSFVIIRTGSTEGLRDVAEAMKAYKVPLLSRPGRQARTPDGPPGK